MKIERLTVSNFMMLHEADIDLSGGALHCFCGSNEAGKSSISEAIRFALLGDTPRVSLKKDYPSLVSEGEKKGAVKVRVDGIEVNRDVATGKAGTDVLANLEASAIAALRVALGAQGFVDMKQDERRRMMFDVVGLSLNQDEILKRLAAREANPELVKTVTPMLRASIDSAAKYASEQQKIKRAEWQATTGEAFGSEKGANWKATPPKKLEGEASMTTLEAAAEDVKHLEGKVQEGTERLGALREQVRSRRAIDEQLQRLATFVENQDAIAKDKGKLEADAAKVRQDISEHQSMLDAAAKVSKTFDCPGCSAHLKLDATGDDLEFADPTANDFADTMPAEQRSRKIAELNATLAGIEAQLKTANARLDAISKQATLKNDLVSKQSELCTEKQLLEAEQALSALQVELSASRELLGKIVAYNNAVEAAGKATIKAAACFKAWSDWGLLAEALSPEGIPAEILSEALEEVNRRLAASAGLAGWGAPYIDENMNVYRGEMPYLMLSESARWRVAAVIAEVIATLSGVKILVLDRWDVLDGAGRVQFMKWVRTLAEDSFDSIITIATLKGSPTEKPQLKGFEVHWVEHGAVS